MSDPAPMPEGYVPTRSAVSGIKIYMPAPQIDDYETLVSFACPNCGGKQAYSIRDGGLSCTTCGYYQPPQGEHVGRSAEAQEFRTRESEQQKAARLENQLGTATAAAVSGMVSRDEDAERYDWGEGRDALDCENCGATMLLAPKSLTHVCPFCGSSSVVQHQFTQDALRPRYLVPFKIETETAKQTIIDWLGSSWLTPRDLRERAGLDELTGIFLPYWTFSAICSADWKAQVGHDRTTWYTDSQGRRRSRTTTHWRWESGSVNKPIRELLVPGTAKLNPRLLDEVDQFDMRGLVEYDPSYLAGFNAQTFDIGREQAWTRGRELMREITKRACYGQASTSKIRNFSMTLDYADETWRYVLLPVYLTTYRYEADAFSVMVNGQTGEITGQRPVVWKLVVGVSIAALVPGLIVALSAFFFTDDIAQTILIGGIVLFLAGLAFDAWVILTAINIRKAW